MAKNVEISPLQAAILRRLEAGLNYMEAAEAVECSHSYAAKVAKQWGYSGSVRPTDATEDEIVAAYRETGTIRATMRLVRVSEIRLRETLDRLGIPRRKMAGPMTENDWSLVSTWRSRGVSWKVIGTTLNRHPERIREQWADRSSGADMTAANRARAAFEQRELEKRRIENIESEQRIAAAKDAKYVELCRAAGKFPVFEFVETPFYLGIIRAQEFVDRARGLRAA